MGKRRKKAGIKAKIRKFLTEYFHCIAWAAAGIYILATDRITHFQYFITWAALITVMWRCMPNKQKTKTRGELSMMIKIMEKYPIGSTVRLNGSLTNNEPRTVQGYKQIGGTKYLIFDEGDSVCVQKVKGGTDMAAIWKG